MLIPESSKPPLFSPGADFNWISSVWPKCRNWQDTFGFGVKAKSLSAMALA
jgi:hypothetical protein